MHSLLTLFARRLRRPSLAARTRPTRLAVTPLEDRLVPVVGAFDIPAAVNPGAGFDGVVRVMDPSGGNCSGTLLWTGRHILTAAHCVDSDVDSNGDGFPDRGDGMVDAGNFAIQFDMGTGPIAFTNITKDKITLAPGWNGDSSNGNDVAIIELPAVAPLGAERFHPYRGTNEDDKSFTVVGYGRSGEADAPDWVVWDKTTKVWSGDTLPGGVKRSGVNIFDAVVGPNDSRLEAELDQDSDDWPVGGPDVSTARGDSGGPAFVSGPTGLEIAGVTSRGSKAVLDGADNTFTRVSSFVGWIDQTVAAAYDLVVDMKYQPWGDDQVANLLEVNAAEAGNVEVALDGYRVWSDATARVKSITLIGSPDDELFIVRAGDRPMPVTVDGGGGKGTLEVVGSAATDWANVYDDVVHLTPNAAVLPRTTAAIGFDNMTLVRVNTLGGADAITVDEATATTPVVVSAGEQNDTITLTTPERLASDVTVHGNGGADTITVRHTDNFLDWFETDETHVYADRVEFGTTLSGNPLECYFDGTENLTLQGTDDPDYFYFHQTPPGVRTTIDGNGGTDLVWGEDVTVTWTLTGANAGNMGGVTRLNFQEVETLRGGTKADRFEFAAGGSLAGIIDGGAGTDTLAAGGQANLFTVTGAAAGSLNAGTFSAIDALVGGTGDDRFALQNAATFAGTIVGGSGADALDYSAYDKYVLTPFSPFPQPVGVTVNLATGAATGVSGGATGIDYATGWVGNDTLTGNTWSNVLCGGAGKDTLDGGAGRDILVGGAGADVLIGGSGDDILIAGTVSFETNPTGMLALLGGWASPLPYADRVAALRVGITIGSSTYRLDATTVTNDPDVDTLTGGSDRDWFWASSPFVIGNPFPADTITDRVTAPPFPSQPDLRETLN